MSSDETPHGGDDKQVRFHSGIVGIRHCRQRAYSFSNGGCSASHLVMSKQNESYTSNPGPEVGLGEVRCGGMPPDRGFLEARLWTISGLPTIRGIGRLDQNDSVTMDLFITTGFLD